jgi:Folate-dependent phosphoribosylglycinamide formyltransferase PurN
MYGINVHRAVLAAKESKSGITIHYVTEEFDKGEIIAQYNLDLDFKETAETLEKKIHELELHYFPMVLAEVLKKSQRKTKN